MKKMCLVFVWMMCVGMASTAHSETQQDFSMGTGASKSTAQSKAKAQARADARTALQYLRNESDRNETYKVKYRKPKIRVEDCWQGAGERWTCNASWTLYWKWVKR